MRLSEAIRLGAMLKPQAFGDYTDGIGTCALGAANEAIGLSANDDETEGPWPFIAIGLPCPSCGVTLGADPETGLGEMVEHLNDYHRWTREVIADFVETIEAQHEASMAKDSAAGCDESQPVVCGVETNN